MPSDIEVPVIKDFEQFIEPHLNGSKLMSYTTKFLTKPGDNYGSIMLSVTANIVNTQGQIVALPLVAKIPPVLNEFYFKLFEPERTCRSENAIYTELVPMIKDLETELSIAEKDKIKVFPKSYGTRLNLLGNKVIVDKNAVLVLENLQASGYKAGDRSKPFDLEHTFLILTNLAKFHAAPIALRTRKLSKYNERIAPHFRRFDINKNMEAEFCEDIAAKTLNEVEKATNNNDDMVSKYKELNDLSLKYMANLDECPDGLYTTIAHYDFWINNMMIKYDENNHPISVKMVDFQIAQYESLAHDLYFFLFSSVDSSVLQEKFNELLVWYYDHFINALEIYGCPIGNYTFKSFMDEMTRIAPIQIPHTVFMLKVLFADVKQESFKDLDPEMFTKGNDENTLVDDKYYKKLLETLTLSREMGYF